MLTKGRGGSVLLATLYKVSVGPHSHILRTLDFMPLFYIRPPRGPRGPPKLGLSKIFRFQIFGIKQTLPKIKLKELFLG